MQFGAVLPLGAVQIAGFNLMRVRDHQLHATQAAPRQALEKP
jgi:hypothetical protein